MNLTQQNQNPRLEMPGSKVGTRFFFMSLLKELHEEYLELSWSIDQTIIIKNLPGTLIPRLKVSRRKWIAQRRTINQILTAYYSLLASEGKSFKHFAS